MNRTTSLLLCCCLTIASIMQISSVNANPHVDMYTDNCFAAPNYFEFQLNITNSSTAGETIFVNTPGNWRITFGSAIIPSGTYNYTLSYIAGSADPMFAPLFVSTGNTYSMNYTPSSRLMQCSFSNSVLGNYASPVNARILPGQTVNAGRFRLTINGANWVDGLPVGLSWFGTTSGITAYIDSSASTVPLNTSSTCNLDTMCVMYTPTNTGVNFNRGAFEARAYPNPCREKLYIESAAVMDFVQLVDLLGETVASSRPSANKATIETAGLVPGCYMLRVRGKSGETLQRIVIQ